MEESNGIVIDVNHVYKDFILPSGKSNTIKGLFTSFYKRKSKKSVVQHALKDVSLQVNKGEFFGIVGRNGSGKSTLLKMLAGIYSPTEGTLRTEGKLVPFIELGVGFNPELTGRENVYLNGSMMGFTQAETDAMYDEIVEFAELEDFMGQKLKNYSSGMQVRLAFSVAVKAQADILLVDEVLAVGDADFQRKCFAYFKSLKKDKKTVVFVTHDMGAVREFCDRAMLIDNSKVVSMGKPQMIASQYSQLFIDESERDENDEPIVELDEEGKRWGDGKIKITKVNAKIRGDSLLVDLEAKVNRDLDSVIYGLHVIDQDGTEVTAMNNRMIQERDLEGLKSGERVLINWEMLNIFNDGNYTISLTLVNDSGIAFDWYTDASSFKVRRENRSTTAVLPPVKVKSKVIK